MNFLRIIHMDGVNMWLCCLEYEMIGFCKAPVSVQHSRHCLCCRQTEFWMSGMCGLRSHCKCVKHEKQVAGLSPIEFNRNASRGNLFWARYDYEHLYKSVSDHQMFLFMLFWLFFGLKHPPFRILLIAKPIHVSRLFDVLCLRFSNRWYARIKR